MLTAFVLLALVIATALGYAWGRRSMTRAEAGVAGSGQGSVAPEAQPSATTPAPSDAELVRNTATSHADDFAEERHRLFEALAAARAETARYRDLVIDIENNAPPPLLGGRGTPDDLKLIVGIGPVLERMLHQLGVTTYRQIARWSERDIDEFDARLAEFPGRIRRDAWVTQARALHQSLHGDAL